MEAIGSAFEEALLQKICASPFYSIILDESTDLSTVKQLGLVVQYIDMKNAIPQTKYSKLIHLSPVIVNAVTTYLTEKASPAPGFEKLHVIGAACDGASVLLGKDNGAMV